jgi:hypothetical protein
VDKEEEEKLAWLIKEKHGVQIREARIMVRALNSQLGNLFRKRGWTFEISGFIRTELTYRGKQVEKIRRHHEIKKSPDYHSRMY